MIDGVYSSTPKSNSSINKNISKKKRIKLINLGGISSVKRLLMLRDVVLKSLVILD